MEFQEHRWSCPGISHIGGLSKECAYTFSIFVKLGESIFSALVKSGQFFVSDKADRYFVSSPLEWGFEVVIGEDILKQGFGDN